MDSKARQFRSAPGALHHQWHRRQVQEAHADAAHLGPCNQRGHLGRKGPDFCISVPRQNDDSWVSFHVQPGGFKTCQNTFPCLVLKALVNRLKLQAPRKAEDPTEHKRHFIMGGLDITDKQTKPIAAVPSFFATTLQC